MAETAVEGGGGDKARGGRAGALDGGESASSSLRTPRAATTIHPSIHPSINPSIHHFAPSLSLFLQCIPASAAGDKRLTGLDAELTTFIGVEWRLMLFTCVVVRRDCEAGAVPYAAETAEAATDGRGGGALGTELCAHTKHTHTHPTANVQTKPLPHSVSVSIFVYGLQLCCGEFVLMDGWMAAHRPF
jgi:hypothetical protein